MSRTRTWYGIKVTKDGKTEIHWSPTYRLFEMAAAARLRQGATLEYAGERTVERP